MTLVRVGIICPSEIAYRRFMPAILSLKKDIIYVGLAIPCSKEIFLESPNQEKIDRVLNQEKEKAQLFIDNYGGKLFYSYESIVSSNEIDAIYIPLPPALHFKWAKKALEYGKHVLVEKPSTISENDSLELIRVANSKHLAIHENYMFVFHNQLKAIEDFVESGEIGEVRLYRISFGFPKRQTGDFRYIKSLGGGALIDAGGYTLKYASMILGKSTKILYSMMNHTSEYDVDLYGSGALCNDAGDVVQISFGMDNEYKCELEVWGSKGILLTGRVLTAPVGFAPKMIIKQGDSVREIELPSDDAFKKSIQYFIDCIINEKVRKKNYQSIAWQAKLFNEFIDKSKR